jgi:MazG family protein
VNNRTDPGAVNRLLEIMAALRNPNGGCPWDLEQDFDSIAPYTIEEAYEVADAIQRRDFTDLTSELGDLLFQVVYHAQMASEVGQFEFKDVVDAINQKMIRRHPHVFGDKEVASAEAQTKAWDQMKAEERSARTAIPDEEPHHLDGIPITLPAMTRAVKLQNRAANVGFDWDDWRKVFTKLEEELGELTDEINVGPQSRIEEELGDVLFVMANLARHLKIDPEAALRNANKKFERRFGVIETGLKEEGQSLEDASLEAMEALWNKVRQADKTK